MFTEDATINVEGRLEYCALLLEIVAAQWGVTTWMSGTKFHMQLELGDKKEFASGSHLLPTLQYAWRNASARTHVPSIG